MVLQKLGWIDLREMLCSNFHYHSLFTLAARALSDIAPWRGGWLIRGGFAPRSNALNPQKDTPFGRNLPLQAIIGSTLPSGGYRVPLQIWVQKFGGYCDHIFPSKQYYMSGDHSIIFGCQKAIWASWAWSTVVVLTSRLVYCFSR